MGVITSGHTMTDIRDDLAITLGVEEELFLVDPGSRDLLRNPDAGIFETCQQTCGPHKVVGEFLRCQIETNTQVCHSVAEVRKALQETRAIVIDAAEQHDARIMASSTHPFAPWEAQQISPGKRYQRFLNSLQDNVRHFVSNGMHIHAGFGNPDTRIRVMTALRRYLPLLHALSTSSPFNSGRDTKFKSYRLSLIRALPRTGIPNPYYSRADYDRMMAAHQGRHFIQDGSELWWDIRPSHTFPTIELRICDVCTRIEDGVSIAALYACLIRYLMRRDAMGMLPPEPFTELIEEDRWIAQRDGISAAFGHQHGDGGRLKCAHVVEELLEELSDDAWALNCKAELNHALAIVQKGTCADHQLACYQQRRQAGDGHGDALRHVVDLVLERTKDHPVALPQ